MKEHDIIICLGSSCFMRGNKQTTEVIKNYVKQNKLSAKIEFKGQLCSSLCSKGPIVIIDKHTYENVTKDNIVELLDKTIKT
ncbi:MAG: NAD(P)H-dependent oxidoreductase subunit E [Bacteroidales bacterium]|jgi:NADH:ubiquinone oxidoreductase subunit E|nr:NAD(P)H-dependent oxidoreductase subunit E [Bacteroidales bacterium]MDD3153021.1 NAD(P)H-dependent oxidoreductase subunit E [Bacteroidales bacterium]MDD3914310.1 NAD(P)H-dependent oxidoreductase subunit E [Bacteroidales bacterium]MDD4634373.1 NAD(P)H-dependent oxidoreductase subunit E [Bacteroidales bacterium]